MDITNREKKTKTYFMLIKQYQARMKQSERLNGQYLTPFLKPALIYASEPWRINKSHRKKITVTEMSLMRKISRKPPKLQKPTKNIRHMVRS